ncbi:carbon storage regulator [Candidatus Pacearchaeota archaeon]|nr:carbon storage regulator [Candidatus Pacearchaeota archaeon]
MTSENYNPDKIGLVIAREQDEKIYILRENANPIIITLVEIKKGRARLGFNASADDRIYREEVIGTHYPSILEQLRQGGVVTKDILDFLAKPDKK